MYFTFSVPLVVAGGFNIWSITPEERGKHDKQFDSLAPALGYLSGKSTQHAYTVHMFGISKILDTFRKICIILISKDTLNSQKVLYQVS